MTTNQRIEVALEVMVRHWWTHFKGGLYFVLKVEPVQAPLPEGGDPRLHFVVKYRKWGTNDVHERPLAEWLDRVEREGYAGWRFMTAEWERAFPEELRPCRTS